MKGENKLEKIKKIILRPLIFILLTTFFCGIVYTGIITLVAQAFFNSKANGSIIEADGIKCGSALAGQYFTGNRYMWGRFIDIENSSIKLKDSKGKQAFYPSISNISPAGIKYEKLIKQRVKRVKAAHPEKSGEPVPVELVTSSGSGLDPNITYKAAIYQIERIAKARRLSTDEVKKVIDKCSYYKTFSLSSEKIVNVLEVNLCLDRLLE